MKLIYFFETLKTGEIFMNIESTKEISGDPKRIGEWLTTDVRDGNYVMERVNKVVRDNLSNEERIWMDGYDVIVKRDFSTIKFNYEEDCPEIKSCTLPTEVLYEILEIWIEEYKKHC